MTPQEIAVVDQASAEFGREADTLVSAYKILVRDRGREQAVADVCAYVNANMTSAVAAAVLAIAVAKLAEAGE